MEITFFQADAFTNVPFKGNAAGVCLLNSPISDEAMQQISMEANLSDTAFVEKTSDGFNLRWFTPTTEVNLCGHATLGAAHILWQQGWLQEGEMGVFHTKSGRLTAKKSGDWIELDFPLLPNSPCDLPDEMISALGVTPVNHCLATDRYIIEVASEEEVRRCQPEFNILKKFEPVVLTSKGDGSSPFDFISRSFVPKHGINEDPVTGSSHSALLPYWAGRLRKTDFLAYQASARGGELKVRLINDRALISGQAVTVLEGKYLI